MHLKRQEIPKKWPIPRKGTKYIIRPASKIKEGIPLLIILRDILKIAQNRKEVKKAIYEKKILLNNRPIKNEKNSAVLFDKINVVPAKKNYEICLSEKGRFDLREVKDSEANHKISKIENKKMLKGKKTQLNLSDGRNIISNMECKTNDSVLINFNDKKIQKCLPLKEKTKVIVFAGKHSGITGIINKIDFEKKIVELDIGKHKLNVLIKQIMVIE